eukprot:586070-Prorocentrum_minimum.AAC.3
MSARGGSFDPPEAKSGYTRGGRLDPLLARGTIWMLGGRGVSFGVICQPPPHAEPGTPPVCTTTGTYC